MSYYDEEFYNEPSEFEQQVDSFKLALVNSVKAEFEAEMEKLRTENAELQVIKTNFNQIKNGYQTKERQLEIDRENMVRTVRGERLQTLFKDCEVLMFVATTKREYLPKCDKCNDKRQINYITPLGKQASESCECNKIKNVYIPSEHLRTEFRYNGNNRSMTVWYKPYKDDSDTYSSGQVPDSIYEEGTPFEELGSYYRAYFKTEEQCQNYCDWLNAKEVFE